MNGFFHNGFWHRLRSTSIDYSSSEDSMGLLEEDAGLFLAGAGPAANSMLSLQTLHLLETASDGIPVARQ